MKKFKLLLLGVLMILPLTAFGFEYTYEGQTLSYWPIGDGQVEVGTYDDTISGDVIIPESVEYEGEVYTVTTIREYAFMFCRSLTSINIPESVTSIGKEAFYSCESLSYVNLPASVTYIGDGAFAYCHSLVSVIILSTDFNVGANILGCCGSLKRIITKCRDIEAISNMLTVLDLPNTDLTLLHPTELDTSSLLSTYHNLNCLPGDDFIVLEDGEVRSEDGKVLYFAPLSISNYIVSDGIETISTRAFSGTPLTSITIPESVTTIGESAFSGTLLTSITIPESVTTVGERAFSGTLLTSITIPGSVTTIPTGLFENCSSLTEVILSNGVTTIGESAFSGTSLTSIIIPGSVTTIPNGLFAYYSSLTEIILSEGVVTIEPFAFRGTSLTSITIPKSITTIKDYAFACCDSLKNFMVKSSKLELHPGIFADITYDHEKNDFDYDWGAIKNKIRVIYPDNLNINQEDWPSAFLFYPSEYADFQVVEDNSILSNEGKALVLPGEFESEYIIPDGVEIIGANAFSGLGHLESLTIPASVTHVKADAFKDTQIDRVIFEDWNAWHSNVTLENLEANPYRNGSEIYAGDIRISAVPELYEGQTEIKDYVNYGLEPYSGEIELPTTLKRVGAYAFYNNRELFHVFLNDGLEEIGAHAFQGCELLENQELPATLTKIEDDAYLGCTTLTEVVLPENLTSLGASVFAGCTALEKAVLVAEIEDIPFNAFGGCEALNKLYLPTQLKSIGNYAFANCNSIDELKLPVSLESIGDGAFKSGSITKLIIPDNVSSIGYSSFYGQSIKDLTIGKGLKTIPRSAFSQNPLILVSFSEGLEKIEGDAFSGCGYISSVILPSTVTEIEENAFGGTTITELVIPDGVTSLPYGSCGAPKFLTVGKGVKTIDVSAFSLGNLVTFRLMANMPPTLSDALPLTDDINDHLTLVVNAGRVVAYKNNARWKQIDYIIEEAQTDVVVYLDGKYPLAEEIRIQSGIMPSQVAKLKVVGPLTETDFRIIRENMISLKSLDLSEVTNVTEITAGQFTGLGLNEIVLPDVTERIGDRAFANCYLLTMTSLPESVRYIGSSAFEGCIRVTFSKMPENLEELGYNAFAGCTAIKEMSFGEKFNGSVPSSAFDNCSLLERVDLSNTGITAIENRAFSWCYELDEILLPETVTSVAGEAFAGTAIRDISFLPTNVTEIGDGAFSYCRRLVAAVLPSKMTSVSSNIFAGCKRLLAVSMDGKVKSVGVNLVNGDKKLANISCAANDAPEAETGAFDNIRVRYITLTVPQLSFRSYLSAPQWGKFETIQNRIPVYIDEDVDVTNVAEDEYQDMVEEDRLEDLQEQSCAPAEEEDPEVEDPTEPTEQVRRRVARRAAARVNTDRSFAKLFDGAQIQSGNDGSGTRIFINPKDGVNVTSVMFDGVEMLDKMEGNSLLLPVGSKGNLEIRTDAILHTNIEDVIYDEATAPIYNLTGTMVGRGKAELAKLQAGIYIFCGRKVAVK